jgi:lipopolysaccharide export system permease protein
MIIWQTAGMPLTGCIRPVLLFSLPIVLIIALMSLLLTPFSNQQNIVYQEIMRRKSDVSRISPGVFRESQSSDRVFFVESFDEENQIIHNIFVHAPAEEGALRVVTANLAEVETTESGQRFIALKEGRAYQGTPGAADFSIMNFERYLIATGTADVNERDLPTRARPTGELIDEPTPKNLNELLWRINIPLVALGLSLMAIPLSVYNPRTYQSANIIFALLTFLVYTNLLNLARSMLSDGKLSFMTATLMVHLSAVLIVVIFFYLGKLHLWIFK